MNSGPRIVIFSFSVVFLFFIMFYYLLFCFGYYLLFIPIQLPTDLTKWRFEKKKNTMVIPVLAGGQFKWAEKTIYIVKWHNTKSKMKSIRNIRSHIDPNVVLFMLMACYFCDIDLPSCVQFKKQKIGWLVHGVKRHFQQYFSYIVAVSFIGGGNRSTRRKSPTCRKSLTNFII